MEKSLSHCDVNLWKSVKNNRFIALVKTHTTLTSKRVNRKKKHFYRSSNISHEGSGLYYGKIWDQDSNFNHEIRESEVAGDQAIYSKNVFSFHSRVTFFIVSIKIHTLFK